MLVGTRHGEGEMKGRGFMIGQLALNQNQQGWGFATMDKEPTFQVGIFHTIESILAIVIFPSQK
jgi:hypothetical protein